MHMSDVKKEIQVKRHTRFNNDFLTVYEDDVMLPNGKPSSRVVVSHIGAAAVLPITEDGDVILVKQHRYAALVDSLEMPAGKKDKANEEGLVCAKRELLEETGYEAAQYTYLTTIHSAIGFSNETIELYVAKGLTKKTIDVPVDEEEFVEVVRMPISEAKQRVIDGEITDAKTIITLLMVD